MAPLTFDKYLICPMALERANELSNPQIFLDLTDQIRNNRLLFTDLVVGETRRFSQDSRSTQWADTASLSINQAVSWDSIQYVLSRVPDLVDEYTPDEQANPQLAGLAWEIQNTGANVCMVTDDTYGNPFRISLVDACGELGIPEIRFDDYYFNHLP